MTATTPDFAEIEETFELMDDWEERYRYVIDLGKTMPEFGEDRRRPELKVEGCASQVWLDIEIDRAAANGAVLRFDGDSDAHIVRGLIAILRALVSGQPAAEIAKSDPLESFARLGLSEHLSKQRSNGLAAMAQRLRQAAAAAAA